MANQNISSTKDDVNKILTMLNEGEAKIKISTQGDFVMVLGNTGAGKSTLVQFLLGNNDELLSKEIVEGTNEFIIQDNAGRININSTIDSTTEIPELVVDKLTNTTFYDCPGFSDTRSPAHEIVQIYLVRKVIQSAKTVKLVLVVNHSSVRQGVDRHDFMSLVKHVTTLVKNIDNYKNSMGLIVSKVENQYVRKNGKFELVSDEAVLNGIIDFMNKVKHDLNERLRLSVTENDRQFYDNAIKFVSALTGQNIALFRRPDEPGLLSQIAIMQDGKKKMLKMIASDLTFGRQLSTDWGFTISDSSKNYVLELVLELRKAIDLEQQYVAAKIKEHYQDIEKNSVDLDYITTIFKAATDKFDYIASQTWTPREFVHQISRFSQKLDFTTPTTNLTQILKYGEYLTFLDTVVARADIYSVIWKSSAEELLNYNHDSLKWYTFLQHLYLQLSQYNFQKNLNQVIANNAVNRTVDIDSLKKYNIPGLITRDVDKILLNEKKVMFLQWVLQITIGQQLQSVKKNNKIVIKGHNVVLSKIINQLITRQFTDIQIFAMDRIFIDVDLNKIANQAHLSLIALTWEIVNNSKTLTLRGENGVKLPKATNGRAGNSYKDGWNGSMGLPGGPAGSFLIIGKQITGGGKLILQSVGGKGGRGQDGGDGGPGKNLSKAARYSCWSIGLFTGCPAWLSRTMKKKNKAGSGGNGGVGGFGGKSGNIKVRIFNGTKQITTITKNGDTGFPGRGGSAGRPNPYNKGSSGQAGVNGESARYPSAIGLMDYGSIINSYKIFSSENQFNRLRTAYFQDFINELEHDRDLSMLYKTGDRNQGVEILSKARKRRDVVENNIPSSACSNYQSSLIGSILSWIANPYQHFVTHWLPTIKEHNEYGHGLNHETYSDSFYDNSFTIGKLLAENETVTDLSVAFTDINLQHNLLFLNLLTCRKFNTKLNTGNEIFSFPNDEIANRMAYNAYANIK